MALKRVNSNDVQVLTQSLTLPKSGFFFVYLSNETEHYDVFFDQMVVNHTPSAILEETHYYPFGLTMAGISNRAFGGVENKKKYNGYELNTDLGINLGESFYRSHDPQIGRFLQLDPKPTDMESLYTAMSNNPISKIDLLGDTTFLYNRKGIYKGFIDDKLAKNEVVMAGGLKIGLLKLGKSIGFYSGKEAGLKARSATFADARITTNTVKELTARWSGSGTEKLGFLYADKATKEVHSSICSSCEATEASGQLGNLQNSFDDVSKMGNIIGMWHSHLPANTYAGADPSKADQEDPTYAINSFTQGALGIVVNRSTITLFPISRPATDYRENTVDGITTPQYSPNYSGFRSPSQFGTFNKNINSKTYWDR